MPMPLMHPNALKHLSEREVLEAWASVTMSIRRESGGEPPRWLMVGWLSKCVSVELVAVETREGWLIIHAMMPVQKKFALEIERAERRKR